MSSDTGSPSSSDFLIESAQSGFTCISFLTRALAEMWTRPNFLARSFAWVSLPVPGGPEMMTLGGLLGALLLNLSPRILWSSAHTSVCYLLAQSCSKMNWSKAAWTPLIFISYSSKTYLATLSNSSFYSGINSSLSLPFNLTSASIHFSKTLLLEEALSVFKRMNWSGIIAFF